MLLIPNIGLAKFKLHPTRNAQENPVTCVLSNNRPAFYTVSPERMEQLIKAEQRFAHAEDLIEAVKQGRLIAEDL